MNITKHNHLTLTLVLKLTVTLNIFSQTPFQIIDELPLEEWSGKEKDATLSDVEKMERLKMLPEGERIDFVMEYGDEEHGEENTYWKYDASALIYLDLDFDGDLDLLFSGQSGSMSQTSTKIYYNHDNVLTYHSGLRNGVIDIKKNTDSYSVYTLFQPCCGSYTARIEQYKFSRSDTAIFEESTSIIGQSRSLYKGMKSFLTQQSMTISNPSLYAFPTNLRKMSAYFRKRDKEIKLLVKQQKPVELIKLDGMIELGVLGKTNFNEEEYSLVITTPLSDLPRMPTSLYEWSEGNGRRLVGWVKSETIK